MVSHTYLLPSHICRFCFCCSQVDVLLICSNIYECTDGRWKGSDGWDSRKRWKGSNRREWDCGSQTAVCICSSINDKWALAPGSPFLLGRGPVRGGNVSAWKIVIVGSLWTVQMSDCRVKSLSLTVEDLNPARRPLLRAGPHRTDDCRNGHAWYGKGWSRPFDERRGKFDFEIESTLAVRLQ